MKKTAFVLFSLFATISVSAQEVVSTQGDSYSNTSGSIDFTVGEVVINTGTDGSNSITQGFHQSNWSLVGVVDHDLSYEAIVFPNPTEDILNIRTHAFENVMYSLYDAQGKLIIQNKLSAEQTLIQVSHLAAGSYSLILNNKIQKLKTFKLVKIN
jgi:hypothetical protein